MVVNRRVAQAALLVGFDGVARRGQVKVLEPLRELRNRRVQPRNRALEMAPRFGGDLSWFTCCYTFTSTWVCRSQQCRARGRRIARRGRVKVRVVVSLGVLPRSGCR